MQSNIKVHLRNSMLFSFFFLIWIHYLFLFESRTLKALLIIPLAFFMIVSGFTGLYFSTKLKPSCLKWFLLLINFFFATYINLLFLGLYLF
ncbi:hypothetical protein BH747_04735 [Enterococcus villorum]|uniref:Uncharacterized protein n=1 Tax=Enterococcus villorum TaxID=112904 RepID=A0A1V8YVC0_9ENTE|nr:hypothetical protein BH747_04735 [Enterococcus villorum]OQO76544.1 hypothetical protein BH744_02795 [Enterococcus villorum]